MWSPFSEACTVAEFAAASRPTPHGAILLTAIATNLPRRDTHGRCQTCKLQQNQVVGRRAVALQREAQCCTRETPVTLVSRPARATRAWSSCPSLGCLWPFSPHAHGVPSFFTVAASSQVPSGATPDQPSADHHNPLAPTPCAFGSRRRGWPYPIRLASDRDAIARQLVRVGFHAQ